jgi:hypothetical protein
LCLASCLLALSACVADLETKRGTEGEPCFADNDCRQGLLCQSQTCTASVGDLNNTSNNGANNSLNNEVNNLNNEVNNLNNEVNNLNNEVNNVDDTVAGLCLEACTYFEACGLPLDDSAQGCARECQASQGDSSEQFINDLRCLLSLDCDELQSGGEVCFGGGVPEEREQLCDVIADQILPSCVGDRSALFFGQACQERGTFLSDAAFFDVERCLERNSCQALVSCLEDWADIELGDTQEPEPADTFRILAIIDLSLGDESDFSGADIDAVALFKADGSVSYASTIYDAQLQPTDADDLGELLGAPDSDCRLSRRRHVSMGGMESYLILGFDQDIEPGDSLLIYELGQTWCGDVDNDDNQDEEMYLVLINEFTQENLELGVVRGANALTVDF